MSTGYSPKEVAELLGLSVAEVRRCVRAGILTAPSESGQIRLSFQDLVSLRRAAQLVSAQVRPHRVRRALKRLRDQLPDRPLSSVDVSLEGKAIVAREGGTLWNPISGQMHLDFQPAMAVGTEAAPIGRAVPSTSQVTDAEAAYALGCDVEEAAPVEAEAHYRRALALLPTHVDARINLGRLLHEQGRVEEAASEYRHALEVEAHPVASFNLGVALEDLGRIDAAVQAYQSAIAADPRCEDAYFNLARIYERQGDRPRALGALRTYRALTRA